MISFDKPLELNGSQLCDELENAGVSINRNTSPIIYGDSPNTLWLDINPADTQKTQDVLNTHIPLPAPEPTIADKLASVGLSLDELKTALGL